MFCFVLFSTFTWSQHDMSKSFFAKSIKRTHCAVVPLKYRKQISFLISEKTWTTFVDDQISVTGPKIDNFLGFTDLINNAGIVQ